MPYINLHIGSGLEDDQRIQLFERMTALMNIIMGKRREVTVVHIEESKPWQWFVNAAPLSQGQPLSAYVDIKVTAGTNTPEEKAEMIDQTVRVLREVVGAIQESCYVVIDDVPPHSWGYNGKTQSARAVLKV